MNGRPRPVSGIPDTIHPLLSSAREKVRWAESHLDALEANYWELLRQPGALPALRADLDPKTGYHIVRIKSIPDYSLVKTNTALAVGDVVGNLRASLDHTIWAIVNDGLVSSHPDHEGVAFPIRDNASRLKDQRGRDTRVVRCVHPYVSSDVWDVVLRCLLDQPYPGAEGVYGTWGRWNSGQDHPLRILQDFSNDDKHRLLPFVMLLAPSISLRVPPFGRTGLRKVPLVHGSESKPGDLIGVSGHVPAVAGASVEVEVPDTISAPYGQPIELDMEVLRGRYLDAEPHVEDAGNITPHIAFQDASDVQGTLNRIVSFVKFLLTEFERVLPP